MIRTLLIAGALLVASALPAGAVESAAARVDALHARFQTLYYGGHTDDAAQAAIDERDLAVSSFGQADARTARAFMDVGTVAEALHQERIAEEAFRQGIIIQSKVFDASRVKNYGVMISYLHSYGSFLNLQSRFSEAEYYLGSAMQLSTKMNPMDEGVVVPMMVAYASAELQLGKVDVARNVATSILTAWRGSHQSPDIDVRNAFLILGQIADGQHAYAAAEENYRQALAIHVDGDDQNLLYATALALAGEVYFDDATTTTPASTAKLDLAEKYYTEALAVYRRDPGATGISERYRPEERLAELQSVRGQYDRSVTAFEALLKELRAVFDERFPYMSEDDRLAFVSDTSDAFDQFYVAAWHDTDHRDTVGEMYDVALWHKGLVLRSIESLRAKITALGDPKINALFQQITQGREAIAQLSVTPGHDPNAVIIQLDKTNNDEQELAQTLSDRGVHLTTDIPTWQQVAEKLGPSEAAIEFVDTNSGYLALVLTHDHHGVFPLGSESEIGQDALAAYRSELGLATGTQAKQTFYDLAWKPLLPALQGITRVYVSSDGVLNQTTFDAVPDDSGKLLMQTYDIRRVESTAVLAEPARASKGTTAELFGDPQYYKSGPDPTTCANAVVASRSAPTRGRQIVALPCTSVEVQDAGSALHSGGLAVVTNLGIDASKTRLAAVQGPRVVHVATHGFFSPDNPTDDSARFALGGAASFEDPMIRSGLILAGGGETWQGQPPMSPTDNGILTAYEAAGLNLEGTELVVLSACDSGLGTTTAGEGVFGLQRAFAEAGAHMVMMSMWDVPDRETQELLQAFYAKWVGGASAFTALRAAEVQERAVVIQRYGHDIPTDWAGFMLVMN